MSGVIFSFSHVFPPFSIMLSYYATVDISCRNGIILKQVPKTGKPRVAMATKAPRGSSSPVKPRVNDIIMDGGLWYNHDFKAEGDGVEKRSLGDEETFLWPCPLIETPSILVTQHGLLGSQRPKTATQIYAQKCTTKPIAFKPAIEFSTVLIQLLWKKCAIQDAPVPKEKSWGRILDKILFSDIIHLALFYFRTEVCNIWSYPKSHSARCSAGLIMFLVHTGPFHSLVPSPSHLG